MICPNCGKLIAESSKFCNHCGAAIKDSEKQKSEPCITCVHCSASTPISKQKCIYCGKNPRQNALGVAVKVILTIVALVGILAVFAPVFLSVYFTDEDDTTFIATQEEYHTEIVPETLSESEYKETCEMVEYNNLARTPEKYVGKGIASQGEVVQIVYPEYGNIATLRIALGFGFVDYSEIILATADISQKRILEGDTLYFYGDFSGMESYESVLGSKITLPYVDIKYFDIAEQKEDTKETVTTDEEGNKIVVFDGLEITFGADYTFTTTDNQYSDYYGKDVISIPVTVKNISTETSNFNYFYLSCFGSLGTEISQLNRLFDAESIFNDLRSNATTSGFLYIPYDGDGNYYLELNNYSEVIEVEISILKP